MPEDNRNYDGPRNDNCCGGGFMNGLFGGRNDGCCDSGILFFIIIFLLLFTNQGCCGRR